jgi:hypothetical protein
MTRHALQQHVELGVALVHLNEDLPPPTPPPPPERASSTGQPGQPGQSRQPYTFVVTSSSRLFAAGTALYVDPFTWKNEALR